MDLPIESALPDLIAALRTANQAVLQAPPGAGKTTRVPLAMLEDLDPAGRIVMLEPRRLAARAAAERMADTLGQDVGRTVGYRIRGDSVVSQDTRIEVVTEGILTRMLQSDPNLPGVSAVIFDEFHERSLNADLGLALCLEVRAALRPDLMLLVMSATLDAAPVAALMGDAPLITSEGRAFPVETRWLDRPLPRDTHFVSAMADLTARAVGETSGGLLAFLPGEGEIRRLAGALDRRLPADVTVHPLFGALPFAQQRAAIAPAATGRKLVLATAIAETSLTLQDVRVVIDGGKARRARFDPGSGMSRLVTERVSRAEAAQREGRAGRVAEGVCYRMWSKGEDGALAAYPPAEIEAADLTGLALELALWGVSDPRELPFLTVPPAGAFGEAQALLRDIGALNGSGITAHGRSLARMPLHPRLAHMLQSGGASGADLAALLSDRDILRGAPVDLTLRLRALKDPTAFARSHPFAPDRAAVARIRQESRRLVRLAPKTDAGLTPAQRAALAYPDRIAQRRPGDAPRFVLSGGKGASLDAGDPLGAAPMLVVTDTDGNPREARIRQALQISLPDLREVHGAAIHWEDICAWDRRARRVLTRRRERFGALVLEDRVWSDPPPDAVARAMLEGVRDLGLTLPPGAERLRARVQLCREEDPRLPDMSDTALMETLDTWLLPHLDGVRSAADWKAFDPTAALGQMLDWEQTRQVDRATPAHLVTPLGRRVPIDYSGADPEIEVRLQEMFGTTRHPTVAGRPLRVTLLSPARRPVQTTMDLPGFWTTSYADVRKDMRARYPRHPWPEDPATADPTLRARPSGA